MGEMPAAGAYHDQWRTEDVAEPESEAGHPDTFRVEGLESSEVDPSEADPDQLADIEVDEMDPDTGLRAGATADAAAPQEDLSDEMDVRDVPEPPFEQPWEGAPGAEDEPGWLSGVGTPESDVSADAEEEAAESVWSGADWEGETDPETTPHAWTEEADDEVDASPPVRDYFGGLLGWSGAQPGREDDSAADRGEDDDDLDMFRSWLESLKQ